MGLKENDEFFNEEIVWFNGEESVENGLMEAMDEVLAKVQETLFLSSGLSTFVCGLVFGSYPFGLHFQWTSNIHSF